MKDKRVVFMGSPEFSLPILEMLIKETNVILVVSEEDKLTGRKQVLMPTPVKKLALENNIEVYTPHKIRNEYEYILEKNPDIIITCAYGQIIPKELLFTPKYKAINVHASLLPYLRGGAPLHRAIIDGYDETGITIMYMDIGMDDGDIIDSKSIKICDEDTMGTIHDKLSIMGRDLLLETLPSIFNNTNNRIKQDTSKVTFAPIIKRSDELIDFNKSSRCVFNQIRGLYPYPCSYTTLNNEIIKVCESKIGTSNKDGEVGEIINIYKEGLGVKTLDGEIILTRIKPAGKKEMSVKDYLNGNKNNLLGEKLC